jgi:hypothetical protein
MPGFAIGVVNDAHPRQVIAQVRHQRLRKHGHTILLALGVANDDLTTFKVSVLDS